MVLSASTPVEPVVPVVEAPVMEAPVVETAMVVTPVVVTPVVEPTVVEVPMVTVPVVAVVPMPPPPVIGHGRATCEHAHRLLKRGGRGRSRRGPVGSGRDVGFGNGGSAHEQGAGSCNGHQASGGA
jgi:hypothetical protein